MKTLSKLLTAVMAAAAILPFMRGIPVHAAGDIKIDSTHFPDENFRTVIAGHDYDKDLNGYLSEAERNSVINVHCENSNIVSIQGIEYFPNVEGLWCLNNKISSWDLSGNTHLKGIWCSKNSFTSLDFSKNPELEWVYCYGCKLKSLNLKNNPEIAYVECNANPNLTKLDLSKNTKLENLFCSDCNITSLDLSNNPLLCELDAFNNKLTSIDLSNNTLLKRLDIWNNPNLGNVDVSKLPSLEFYNCAKTGATAVDVTHNPELQMLVCSYNEYLTSLDLSQNPRLAVLHLECDWRLTSFDISNNPKLYYLQAFGLRGISTLDISNNSRLIKAYQDGVYKDESHLGDVHSYTVNYGGSGEYFDNLVHCLVVDNDVNIVTNSGQTSNVTDSYIDTNDGHSDNEQFATREEAIQLLYQLAGSPYVSGKSKYKDVPSTASYAKAVKWGQDNNICFGYPDISSDVFGVGELISRQDFALMAHRFAGYMGFGTAFDYGRTDWFYDFEDIDYYAWGAFTWSVQWEVIKTKDNYCYPHGRLTKTELQEGADQIFHLDQAASYSSGVNANSVDILIVTQPRNVSCEAGSIAEFSVLARGESLKYQWQVLKSGKWANCSINDGAKTPTLSLEAKSSRNGLIYRCVLTDAKGKQITSDEVALSVIAPLSIVTEPSDYSGKAGGTAVFSVKAEGDGLKYQWQTYKNGAWTNCSKNDGAKTDTLALEIKDSRDGAKYHCVITDANDETVTTKEVMLTIDKALEIVNQPVDCSAVAGETASFTVVASGSGLKYQWQVLKNGEWVNCSVNDGAKTPTLSMEAKSSRNGKVYHCVITDSNGISVISDEVSLTVTG